MWRRNSGIVYYGVYDWTIGALATDEVQVKTLTTGPVTGVWVGSKTGSSVKNSIPLWQSYIGCSTEYAKNDPMNFAASIDSVLKADEGCIAMPTSDKVINMENTASLVESRTKTWQDNSIQGSSIASNINVNSYDQPVTDKYDEISCSTDTPNITGIVPGFSDGGLCVTPDNTYVTLPFTPPSFDPAGDECNDLSPLWIYSVDQTPLGNQNFFVKVSIDPITNIISVKADPSAATSSYLLTVTAALPNMQTSTFTFTLNVAPAICKTQPFTVIPTFDNWIYYVSDAAQTYIPPDFQADPSCPAV